MSKYRIFILCLFASLVVTSTQAQEKLNYFFRHISQSDGLLHNDVHSIVQDSKGFIWIATSNGLQRYDGSRFLNYAEMLSDPDKEITTGAQMYVDRKKNQLWISNNKSIEKLELSRNSFTRLGLDDMLKDTAISQNTTYTTRKNEQWILGPHALYNIDPDKKRKSVFHLNILPENARQASFIAADSSNNEIWIVAELHLLLFDKKTKRVYSDHEDPGHHPLLNAALYKEKFARFVMTDSRKNIWVTTWGDYFYKYDNSTKKVSRYSLSALKARETGTKPVDANLLINCVMEDDDHTIWIGTENAGLLQYNEENDDFDHCIVQDKNNESIRYHYKILSLFQDKEQNIWVGTDQGISIFNPYRQYFRSIRHEENDPLSVPKGEIISFLQATNGDMFIGTWGAGIAVYDSRFHFKKTLFYKDQREANFVWSILQADDNNIWIGCQHGYLLIYNPLTGTSRTLQPPETGGSTIRCMEKDSSGNIWLGLHNGKIIQWDKKTERFIPYNTNTQGNSNALFPVLNIFLDKEQECWVSTEAGFKHFDREKMQYKETWLPDKNKATAISGKTCQGIEEYNDSTLLIGTIYGGLNFFNKKTKTFSHISIDGGSAFKTIFAIKKDNAGYIWFTTDYGIFKFDPAGKKFIQYSIEPGVASTSFGSNRFYPLQDGQLLTFTTAEVISFLPGNLEHRMNDDPKTEIIGFRVFDNPLFIDSLLFEDKPVRLTYKENFFTVEFASLNFSSLQQTHYYYLLSGVDHVWVNGGAKRSANYTDLQPGEYTFSVKAENGDHSGKVSSFRIIITPPFWKTRWFITLCLILLAGVIYAIVRWSVIAIRNKEKNKMLFRNQMAEMEMKALRSQMNPHFIFNCINSIDALIQSNDKYHATVYLNKFAKLIRNILDSSKQNTVTLAKDLDTLKLYIELEQLRHGNKFTAVIDAADALLQDDYKVPPLIIQPFVENAILHGIRYRPDNNGKLTVSVIKHEGYLQYLIEDNGVGRDAFNGQQQKEKTSYGIDMSNDRIKLFNHDEKTSVQITDLFHNGEPAGTRVEVILNIQ